jgi:CubicO group peptidase (beta-lactamase class C family)
MKYLLLYLAIFSLLFCCTSTKKEVNTSLELEQKIDKLAQPYIDEAKVAGMVVGVFKDHQPLVLKGYGFADLELNVKLPVDASFEIGSVTKQFTAAAILQLAEQGKLSPEDDITKFINFDTHGKNYYYPAVAQPYLWNKRIY